MYFLINVVPPPMVSIPPPMSLEYAGSFISVNCSIQLSNAVDSQVTVTTVWKKDGRVLTSSANRTVLGILLVSNASLYLSQVVFSPLQLRTEDGVYACEVAVRADSNDFVMSTGSRSNNITLQTAGM